MQLLQQVRWSTMPDEVKHWRVCSNLPGWIQLKLPVQVQQPEGFILLTSLSKVAAGTVTSADGFIHPVISTGCPFLLCSCARISSCTGTDDCVASTALQFVACLGWHQCHMVFRDNPWAERVTSIQSCSWAAAYVLARRKLTWSLWRVLAGALELI